MTARALEVRVRQQPSAAIIDLRGEINAFAERLEEHPQGQLLALPRIDQSIHQAALARVRCQAERWYSQ